MKARSDLLDLNMHDSSSSCQHAMPVAFQCHEAQPVCLSSISSKPYSKNHFSMHIPKKHRYAHSGSGFTLIEVVVALAIFAVAAMALTKVAMQYTQSTANSILRTKAQFVAQNEIAQMEINGEWLQGTQSKQITAQGETWQIDKRAESTISPKVQKIEIQVSLFNQDLGKVETGVTNMVFYNHPQLQSSS
jgi:general secretion pathway protein I